MKDKDRLKVILLQIAWLLGVDRDEIPDYHKKIKDMMEDIEKLRI